MTTVYDFKAQGYRVVDRSEATVFPRPFKAGE